MAIELEGGCRVVGATDGEPLRSGDLLIRPHFDGALSLRILQLDGEATLRNERREETLYVLDGSGSANGTPVARDTAIYVPPSEPMTLIGRMTLASSLTEGGGTPRPVTIARLADQQIQTTGDRWYCELIQGQTTQFVGAIPPGRAPDHFHLYEEVLCILEGNGVMHAGSTSTPIAPGSCVFLPRRQRHCVENRGTAELRLLGVFYPAGSPAVRYPA